MDINKSDNLIENKQEEIAAMFGKKKIVTTKHVTEKVKDEAKKVAGLKKFLEDYSSMKEKKYIEVHIWNEYLMFAELFGIADKVREQFSKLYPDIKTNPTYNVNNMKFINRFLNLEQTVELTDYKTSLQELVQAEFQTLPEYKVVKEYGPDHDKKFEIAVFVEGKQFGFGRGSSKKEAEQNSAKEAYRKLNK